MFRRLRSAAADVGPGGSPGNSPKRKRTRSQTVEEVASRTKKPKKNGNAEPEVQNERAGRVQNRRGKGKKKASIVTERSPSQSETQDDACPTRRVPANDSEEDIPPKSASAGSSRDAGKSIEPALTSSSSKDFKQAQQRHLAKIVQLTQRLEEQTNLVKDHEKLLTQLQQSLTCQVCLDLMFKPYALTSCGHLICYDCLVKWFTTPPDDEDPPPPLHQRKKTCPHCRAVVNDPPVAVWSVKSLVATLTKSGLLPGANTALVPHRLADQAGDADDRDPWSEIFGPTVVHNNNHANAPPAERNTGYYDLEDGGIYRCVRCMHEIWDGICSGCGASYDLAANQHAHNIEAASHQAGYWGWGGFQWPAMFNPQALNYVPPYYPAPLINAGMQVPNPAGYPVAQPAVHPVAQPAVPPVAHPAPPPVAHPAAPPVAHPVANPAVDEDEEGQEESDQAYESSFIDDGEDAQPLGLNGARSVSDDESSDGTRVSWHRVYDWHSEYDTEDVDSISDEESELFGTPLNRGRRILRVVSSGDEDSDDGSSGDESDEGSEEQFRIAINELVRERRRAVGIIESEDESDEESGEEVVDVDELVRQRRRAVGIIDSEDESD